MAALVALYGRRATAAKVAGKVRRAAAAKRRATELKKAKATEVARRVAELEAELDLAHDELAAAQLRGEYQRAGALTCGRIPEIEKKLKDAKAAEPKAFINYRREDSGAYAGRIQDRLAPEFGRGNLFMDVDSIPIGADFVKTLGDEVGKCNVLLAVIGPKWLDVRDENGDRRLDNPDDFVRIEIATALQRNIPVIPILIDDATVPKADQLPEDLKALVRRNAHYVRHASFHTDVDKLIRRLLELGRSSPDDEGPVGSVEA